MAKKLAKDKHANEAMFEIREKGKQHRKAAMKQMFEEMRQKKGALMDQRDGLKADLKVATDPQTQSLLTYKIRDVDAELKSDYIQLLEERGEYNEVFQYKKQAPQIKSKEFKENKEKTEEEIRKEAKEKRREEQRLALERQDQQEQQFLQ